MKTFAEWRENPSDFELQELVNQEEAYNAGAAEQHREDMEFAEWYVDYCAITEDPLNADIAYENWKQNVKGKQ